MKEQLERTFSKSSLKPIHRTRVGNYDVFIADGFVEPAQLPVIQAKFGGAIPAGCWATVWFTLGKIASRGGISLCKPEHDSMSDESKKRARINFAVNAAKDALLGKKLH